MAKKPKKQSMPPAPATAESDTTKTTVKKKGGLRDFSEAILVAFIAAMILRVFVIQAFRIPTGSMKDTLRVGDFLLVNKFIYGVRTPSQIPLIKVDLPFMQLPAFKEPEPGNIVVFKFPKDPSLDYIKRCIAGPGNTIEVRNGEVFLDNKPEGTYTRLKSRVFDHESRRRFDYIEVTTACGDRYVTRQFSDFIVPMDTYGPTRVPQKGNVVQFPLNNEDEWRAYENLIRHEGHQFSRDHFTGDVLIDGQRVSSYTVENDCFFMMGDNRDNSSDSRDWGFLPRDNVVGEALLIYFSWDSYADFFHKIRFSRIGGIIQ